MADGAGQGGGGGERRQGRWLRVGHDLLQPVRAAQLMLEALEREMVPERRREVMADLATALTSMEQMLGSVMAAETAQSGAVVPRIADFVVGDVIEAVARQTAVLGRQKGVEVRAVPSRCVVRSDPVLVQRILANFVTNGVRYSDGGRVLIGCRRRGNLLHVETWDRGVGIAADELPKIFDDFFQVVVPGRDRGAGLGLGLSIARSTAEVLDHRIYVDSRVDVGSMFAITLPLVAPPSG